MKINFKEMRERMEENFSKQWKDDETKKAEVKWSQCDCIGEALAKYQAHKCNTPYQFKIGVGAVYNEESQCFTSEDVCLEHNYCPQCGKKYRVFDICKG